MSGITRANKIKLYKHKNITIQTNYVSKGCPTSLSVELATSLYIYGVLPVPSIICNNINITTHLNIPYPQCIAAAFCGTFSAHIPLEAQRDTSVVVGGYPLDVLDEHVSEF